MSYSNPQSATPSAPKELPIRKKPHLEYRVLQTDRQDFVIVMEFVTSFEYVNFDVWYNRYMSRWGSVSGVIAAMQTDASQFKLQPDHDWETTPALRRIASLQLDQRLQDLMLKEDMRELKQALVQMLDTMQREAPEN